jgi:hypothetical protein
LLSNAQHSVYLLARVRRLDAMFDKLFPLFLVIVLTGCSFEVPDFVGREGGSGDSYALSDEPLPDPVPLPVSSATLEHGLRGIIIRVEGVAPTQGYYAAALQRTERVPGTAAGGPETAVDLVFSALPPGDPQPVGLLAGRVLRAGAFVPERELRRISSVRIHNGSSTTTLALP